MQLTSKFNKGFRFLLKVSVIYSKYTWVITITNAFRTNFDESNCKTNKIWVEKGSECHSRSMKSWLEKNAMDTYSTHREGKSVIAEKLFITLKNKIYKYMTSVSKNMYINK